MSKNIHEVLGKVFESPAYMRYIRIFIRVSPDKDETIYRLLKVLAVNQSVSLDRKDKLRREIRTWVRATYGDKNFFADSYLPRKLKRKIRGG